MDTTQLGRTGLTVSVAGLGCGGSSRVGLSHGATTSESVALVRRALDLGVTFVDTAEAYGTEAIVGEAVAPLRETVVLSTKCRLRRQGRLLTPEEVVASLEASLRQLRTDYVDVFHLHAVAPADYEHALSIAPRLLAEKAKGKIRHLGITETSPNDHGHTMLQRALADGPWEVAMFAFHMMNHNARRFVFPVTCERGIGTLIMFAVRRIFSDPAYLDETLRRLAADGRIPAALVSERPRLGFLVHPGGASSVVDAAYRFARHEPGSDVVLFGTGDPAHLEANIASINAPPLPEADRAELARLFAGLEGVGLDLPRS